MLRAEAKRNTPAGLKLREMLASGSLVDDEVVCEAVGSRLRRELPTRGIILDGFPRTRKQAECLDQILSTMGMPGPVVLHLDVSRERLLGRLTARRQCAVVRSDFQPVVAPVVARDALRERWRRPAAARGRHGGRDFAAVDRVRSFVRAAGGVLQAWGLPPD